MESTAAAREASGCVGSPTTAPDDVTSIFCVLSQLKQAEYIPSPVLSSFETPRGANHSRISELALPAPAPKLLREVLNKRAVKFLVNNSGLKLDLAMEDQVCPRSIDNDAEFTPKQSKRKGRKRRTSPLENLNAAEASDEQSPLELLMLQCERRRCRTAGSPSSPLSLSPLVSPPLSVPGASNKISGEGGGRCWNFTGGDSAVQSTEKNIISSYVDRPSGEAACIKASGEAEAQLNSGGRPIAVEVGAENISPKNDKQDLKMLLLLRRQRLDLRKAVNER